MNHEEPQAQDHSNYQKFKEEMQYKQQLLNRIKTGQKNISAFEQDLLDRHQKKSSGQQQINESNPMLKYAASGGINFVNSGSMPSLGSTHQRNEVMRLQGQTTEETTQNINQKPNIISIPTQTLAREVVVAGSHPVSSRSNQMSTFQSRAPGPMEHRRNTLNAETDERMLPIQSQSPSRGSRYRRVTSSNSKYSKHSRSSYGRNNNGDTLDRHVTNSVPLRRPSMKSPSAERRSHFSSRGNSLTPTSPILSGRRSATQNFGMASTSQKGNPFTTQDERHIVPIVEQSSNREISSINMISIENQIKGQQTSYPTVSDVKNYNIQQHQSVQDDSQQYIFTSVANSIEEREGYEMLDDPHNQYTPQQDEDNKFVFNTKALENEPPIQQDDLSEPVVMSHIKQKQQKVITDQIQKLVRHDQKRHHTGGSFGNLQHMLEPHSYKVNGEATTGSASAFGSNQPVTIEEREPAKLRFKYQSKTEKQQSHKVRIICSDSSEETLDPDIPAPHSLQAQAEYMDSSQEFLDRKYQIRTQNQDLNQKQQKPEAIKEKQRKLSLEKKSQKKLQKSNSQKSATKFSRNSPSNERMSSSSESDQRQNDSQLSLHHTSKKTYGKYFVRSRSRQKSLKRSKSNRVRRRLGSESLNRSKRRHNSNRQGGNKSTLTVRSSYSGERAHANKSFRSGKSAKSYTSGKKQARTRSQKSKRGNSKRRNSTSRGAQIPHGTVPGIINQHRNSSNRPPKTVRHNLNTIQPSSGAVQRPPRQYSTIDTWNNKTNVYLKAKKTNTSQTSKKDSTVIIDPNGPDATLAQRLLIDLAKKYKNMEKAPDMKHHFLGHGSGVAARNAQQTQMIQEIQSLATALIQSDKTIAKINREKLNTQKRLKNIISEQEECMALMQEKIDRLETKQHRTQKSLDRAEKVKRHDDEKNKIENKEMDKIVQELRDKIQKNKEKHYAEKKELVADMEKEFTIQFNKMQKKHDIKLNTLKSINDQLNVKLSEYKRSQPEYDQLQQDYQESLQLLEQLQQQLHNQQEAQDHLVKENKELSADLKRSNKRSEDKILELAKKVEKTQAKGIEQINQLKKEHQCELKKWQISKGQEEDCQKFQFEEKITQLKMTLQSREDKVEELTTLIKDYEDQIYNEKHEAQNREQQILVQANEAEEQRARLELEAKDLEQQVSHMQKVVQWKDELIEDLEKRALGHGRGDQQAQGTIRMLEDQLAQSQETTRQLQDKMKQMRLDHNFQVQNLQDKLQLQQQEIHILAQGFQAQQLKLQQLNTNTAHFSGIGSIDSDIKGTSEKILVQNQAQMMSPPSYQMTTLTDKSEGRHLGSNTNRSRQPQIYANSSAPMGPNYNNTNMSTMREHRQNESGAGPIAVEQNSYISRVSNENESLQENEEENQTKNIEQEDAYQINQARIQSQIHIGPTGSSQPGTFTNSVKEDFSSNQDQLLNTQSLSSTDRQFENYKQTRRLDNHTFGGNANLLLSKESEVLKESHNMADQLNQKDQEIKILWNVINQMKAGSKKDEPLLTQASFGDNQQLIDSKGQLKISHGPMSSGQLGSNYLQKVTSLNGNQSSLMQIPGAYQFASGDHDSLNHMLQPTSTYGTDTKSKEDYKTGALLDSQASLNSINKQELIDVKKRIQKLMGEKNGPSDVQKHQRKGVDESTGSENNTLQTGANASNVQSNDNQSQRISQYAFNSKNECDSESIEQFHFKNQRV